MAVSRGAGALRGVRPDPQAAGQPPGQLLPDEAVRAPGSCARPRRSASSTIPAIRHVYDAGIVGELAFRVGNWIDGEGLDQAVARGPRLIPTVLALARDLLSALEHAHLHGIIVRRIVPGSVHRERRRPGHHHRPPLLQPRPPGRSPGHDVPGAGVHGAGDPGRRHRRRGQRRLHRRRPALLRRHRDSEPPLDPRELRRPTELRPTCPRAIERIVLRAHAAGAGGPLPDRGRDAGGLRLRRRHLRDPRRPTVGEAAVDDRRGPGPVGRSGSAARWATTTSCWRRWEPAGSAGSTGCGTSTWSARSRSRCCTRR